MRREPHCDWGRMVQAEGAEMPLPKDRNELGTLRPGRVGEAGQRAEG